MFFTLFYYYFIALHLIILLIKLINYWPFSYLICFRQYNKMTIYFSNCLNITSFAIGRFFNFLINFLYCHILKKKTFLLADYPRASSVFYVTIHGIFCFVWVLIHLMLWWRTLVEAGLPQVFDSTQIFTPAASSGAPCYWETLTIISFHIIASPFIWKI